MRWSEIGDVRCSVARALSVVGDRWTLLVLRDVFLGARRFEHFEASLGASPHLLSTRLRKLVDHGILERRPYQQKPLRHEYRLTEKGRDLWLVLTALRLWSDKWVFGPGHEPILVRDRETGAVVSGLRAVDAQGNPLDPRQLGVAPGPGASDEDRLRLGRERSEP